MNPNPDGLTSAEEVEAILIIAAYLERLGVTGLRQPVQPERVNRRAVIRYLIAEKLREAQANPSTPSGQKLRTGRIIRHKKR
jgi:hypothetical protein